MKKEKNGRMKSLAGKLIYKEEVGKNGKKEKGGRVMNKIIEKKEGKERKEKIDICVLCGRPTEYSRNTPVSNREGYVGGCGQTCKACRNTF